MTEPASFEEAFRRLEDAVHRLEAGGMPLEDAIDLYDQATVLALRCKALLDNADLRIKQLHERFADVPPLSAPPLFDDEPPPTEMPGLFDRLGAPQPPGGR